MQASLRTTASARPQLAQPSCKCCRTAFSAPSTSCLPQLPKRQTASSRRASHVPRAFGSGMETVNVVSQLLTTGALALGAWYLMEQSSSAYYEQDNVNRRSEPCPRCEGAGFEPCHCTRWSDGDHSGCSTCSKTGYMRCRACGGGGTAVPLLASVRKQGPGGQMPGR